MKHEARRNQAVLMGLPPDQSAALLLLSGAPARLINHASLLAGLRRLQPTGRRRHHGSTVYAPSAHGRCGSRSRCRCILRRGSRTQRRNDDVGTADTDRQDDVRCGSGANDSSARTGPREARENDRPLSAAVERGRASRQLHRPGRDGEKRGLVPFRNDPGIAQSVAVLFKEEARQRAMNFAWLPEAHAAEKGSRG
jgi:hypothetical protein